MAELKSTIDTVVSTGYQYNSPNRYIRTKSGTIYVVYEKGDLIKLAKSTDGGSNWTLLEVTTSNYCFNASIEIDDDDTTVHIAWVEYASGYLLNYRTYSGTGTTFSGVTTIKSNGANPIASPVVACKSNGDVMLVYIQSAASNIRKPYYCINTGSGFSAAAETSSDTGQSYSSNTNIIIDSSQNIHICWTSNEYKLNYQKYTTSWSAITTIETSSGADSFGSSKIAIDNSGNLLIVLKEVISSVQKIKLWKYISSWNSSEISSGTAYLDPNIYINTNGDYIIVLSDGSTDKLIKTITSTNSGSSWGSPTTLITPASGYDCTDSNISGSPRNYVESRPNNGNTCVFYETQAGGTDLKLYMTDGFTWGTPTVAPTVTTQAVTDIIGTTATGNGNVTADGGATVTERGICWKTSTGPTTADSKATATGTTGAFTANITGLTSLVTYYVRAYAINSVGTSYGSEVTFTAKLSKKTGYRVRAYATNSAGTSYGDTVQVTTADDAQAGFLFNMI